MSKEQAGYASIDLSSLPKEGGIRNGIRWKQSVGKKIHFVAGSVVGDLFIKKYIPQQNNIHAKLIVIYNDNEFEISINSISNGYLPFINDEQIYNQNNSIHWSFSLNQRIINNDIDIAITNRKYNGHEQFYQFICNKCGFDSFDYYSKQKHYTDYWISAYNLRKLKHCPCCGVRATIVKPGINDIATIAPWLVPFFPNGIEEAKQYSKGMKYTNGLLCPDCGNIIKEKNLNKLYSRNTNPCHCQDSTSYPNRFLYHVLRQLNEYLDYWETEYSPDWISPKRYDGYIKIHNKEYIIELDGELGHGNVTFFREKDTLGKRIDNIKDTVANNHNITVIRIPCLKITFDILKDSFYEYLKDILPLDKIDWFLLKEQCFKNIHKEICLSFEKESNDINYLSKKYNLSNAKIKNILLQGREFGWCPSYITYEEILQSKKKLALELKINNPNISSHEVSNQCNLAPNAIVNVWKNNNIYDKKLEIQNRIKQAVSTKNKISQKIDTFIENDMIVESKSVLDTINIIKDLYDIDLKYSNVLRVVTGTRNSYKGFVFKKATKYE